MRNSKAWYKIIQLDNQTFCIKEHLHWENTNMYYLIGESFNVIIDTGTGVMPLYQLLKSIDDKPIKVLTTHVHWDHIGNHHEFDEVYCHASEKEWLTGAFPLPTDVVKNMMKKDVDEMFLERMKTYEIPVLEDVKTYNGAIDLGNRILKVIETPGHSPGHVMIHDCRNDYLFTGDHIYEGEIYCHYPSTSPVDYVASTKKIIELSRCKLLTGHHKVILDGEHLLALFELTESIEDVSHGSGKYKNEHLTLWF